MDIWPQLSKYTFYYFVKNTIYSPIKLRIIVQTGTSQIGHKHKVDSFNLADNTDSQVRRINTYVIYYVTTTHGYYSTTEWPIYMKDTTNSII